MAANVGNSSKSVFIVTVSVALAVVVIPTPPTKESVLPSEIVNAVPESAPTKKSSIVPGALPAVTAVM